MPPDDLDETAVFLVHPLKQFLYGFETLIELDAADGSPAKAFFMNSIYNYIATFFLLDADRKPPGGSIYPALQRHGLTHLIDPVRLVLNQSLGRTTFGEVIRVFRNEAFVHPDYRDSDLNRSYVDVDMLEPANQSRFQELLVNLYVAIKEMSIGIILATGRQPEDFGLHIDGN